ncbi:MAG: ABC transporter substrate-binding protein [Thermomicrobiales bacterium]
MLTTITRRQALGGALAALFAPGLAGTAAAQVDTPVAAEWTFTDFLGRVTTLPAPPQRIAAEIGTAAAVYDMGIQVQAVWGGPANDPTGSPEAWGRLPVESVVNISTPEGNPDPEKALQAGTDLFIFGAVELEDVTRYSEDDTPYANLPPIAPLLVWPFLDRVDRTMAEIWKVAIALGAEPDSPENVAAQAALDDAVAALQAALDATPGLTAMFGYPVNDEIYIANPNGWDDVNYFRSLGLNVLDTDPVTGDKWWETLSWEQASKYEPDTIFLATVEGAMPLAQVKTHPTFSRQPAVQADQVGVWSWYFARSPQGVTQLVQNVLDVVQDAEKVTP